MEMVAKYKYLSVNLNNNPDWTDNTNALYTKGQSLLHLLRRLRLFGVQRTLFLTFNDTVVASALLYAMVCWGGSSTDRDRKRLNKLVRRASSVLDCPLDSIEVVGERMMLAKLLSIMDNTSHLCTTLWKPWAVPSVADTYTHYRRSFIPIAIWLFNSSTTWTVTFQSHGGFLKYLITFFL